MPTRSCEIEIAVGSTNDLKPASLICARRNFLFIGLGGYNRQPCYPRFVVSVLFNFTMSMKND